VLLPVAVDASLFVPRDGATVPGLLGFAGRFNDPRKNIALFLGAVAQLRNEGRDVSAVLMGDTAQPAVVQLISSLGLEAQVSIKPGLSRTEMRNCLQTLDVFVLPSHQEGLCIAALEAMACGVPVVSTRCGGPEEFVVPGETGSLVDPNPRAMADAIVAILSDPPLRARLSKAARRMVEDRYTETRIEAIFLQEFKAAFPQLDGARPALDASLAVAAGCNP
jgi:glycosyltransferase involved in cell wall biosynthesis